MSRIRMAKEKVKVVRIRKNAAELLKEKCFEISIKAHRDDGSKKIYNESDLVHTLIEKYAEFLVYEKGNVVIDKVMFNNDLSIPENMKLSKKTRDNMKTARDENEEWFNKNVDIK